MRDRSIRIVCGALLATTAIVTPAQAQISSAPPPAFSQLDENGVDLTTGLVSFSMTEGSIGTGPGAIRFDRIWAGDAGWVDNWTGGLYSATINGQAVTVVQIAGISETFTQSGGVYTNKKANGGTLTQSGNNFTYKAPDGTYIYFFDMGWHAYAATCPGGAADSCRIPNSIVKPNGLKYTYGFEDVTLCVLYQPGEGCVNERTYHRFASVSSSAGYYVTLTYATNNAGTGTAPVADWTKRTGLTFGNSVNPPPSTPVVTYAFPSAGVVEVTDAANRNWRLTTNEIGRISGIRRPGSASDNVTYTYGANDTVISATKDGVTTTYERFLNPLNNKIFMTVTNALGQQTLIVSDVATGRPASIQEPTTPTRTTSYQYDSNSRLTRITRQEGNYTQFTYDSRGNVTERREVSKTPGTPADIVSTANFDATCANPVKCNQPNSTTDARGNTTDYTYDTTHGGVTSITLPAPTAGAVRPQTRIGYAGVTGAFGDIVQLPNRVGACQTLGSCTNAADETVTSANYNSNLEATSVTRRSGDSALVATQGMTYDPVGNLLTVDGPLAGAADTTRYRYNAAREVIGVVGPDPDGAGGLKHRAIRLTYRPDGQVSKQEVGTVNSQSDPDWANFASMQEVETAFDDNSRPKQSTLASGGTAYAVTQTSYDALGRVDCVAQRMTYVSLPASACTLQAPHPTFGNDRISQAVYDAAGQLTQLKVAVGTADAATEAVLTYTANGRLATLKDAESNLTTYEYDGFDRLKKTRFPVTTQGANSSSTTDYEQLTYDPNGNITNRRLRDTQSIGYIYDNLDRMTVQAPPNPDPTVNYGYDNLGRLKTAAKPAFGMSLTFTYDALGRNLAQVGPHGTVSSQWDVAGRRTRLTWPDNFFVDYDYLVTGDMTKIRENGATSGAGLLATFAYDDLGRRASVTRGNGALATYGYDPVSRLQTLTDKPSSATYDQTVTLAYNPASQIVSRTGSNDSYAWTGHGSGSTPSVADGLNRLSSIGGSAASYDARGNLTSDPTSSKSFTYWPSDNALWIASPPWTALSYDPLGRLALIDSASDTAFAYDGLDMIAEYDGAGTMLARYVHGPGMDQPLVRYDGPGTSNKQSLHADERGSIIALSYGAPYAPTINRYDEYGKPQSSNIGRFQYTGQMWLGEVGAYHYKARAYSPTFGGRFLQTDPIGYAGGINLYAYVGNDPVNWVDPLGLDECPKEGEDDPGDQGGGSDPGENCDQPDGDDVVVTGIRSIDIVVRAGSTTFTHIAYVNNYRKYIAQYPSYAISSVEYYKDKTIKKIILTPLGIQSRLPPPPRPPTPPVLTARTIEKGHQDIADYYARQRGWYNNWKNRVKGVLEAFGEYLEGDSEGN